MITWRLMLVIVATGAIMIFVDDFSNPFKILSILLIIGLTLWAGYEDSQKTSKENKQ